MSLQGRAILALLCVVLGCGPARAEVSSTEAQTRHRLTEVRAELQALAEQQTALDAQRGAQLLRLRNADRAVAAAATALRELEVKRANQERQSAELAEQRRSLQAHLQQQRAALAVVLRSVYAQGRHQQIKLLLSQDRVDQVARRLLYQRYLQRDRQQRLQAVQVDLLRLAELERTQSAAAAELQRLTEAAQTAQSALDAQRAEGRRLLAELERELKTGAARLQTLGRDEQRLQSLLESLRDVFADIPKHLDAAQSVLARRGRLPRPLAAKVAVAFGQPFGDGRRSNGWQLAAPVGSEVHAVAHGRVAFADWLKGYGLVLILDHGDGFLSLYAANESLRREVGDWVEAGSVVATVGSSGGQGAPGLYFELRRNSHPLDPKLWLAPR